LCIKYYISANSPAYFQDYSGKQAYCAIEAVSKRIMAWACGADVSLSRTLNYHINSLQAFTSARFCEQIANS
jgi:hypothetical protein